MLALLFGIAAGNVYEVEDVVETIRGTLPLLIDYIRTTTYTFAE